MIRILHTADLHLGREFPFLREKGREYRKQLLSTFEQIVNLAAQEHVSLLVIAGDLFDTNRLHGITIARVLAAFRKLEAAGIRVCILPGTHDQYSEDSIYRFVRFPPSVTVFTPEHDCETFPDLDLTVYGKAFDGRLIGTSPLQGLALSRDSRLHVGLAHCSLKVEGMIEKDTMLLDRDEIAGSGLDYLALGHWHSFRDCSQGRTKACYCGSPEPIYMDQKGAGSAALVTVYDRENVRVEAVRVGSKSFDEITIDVGLVKSIEDITRVVAARADPNLILKITLEGLSGVDYTLDPHEVEDELGGQFFCLRVQDRSSPKLEDVPFGDFPEETVVGKYIKTMKAKIAQAEGEDKAVCEEALKLGYALLQKGLQVIE